MKQRLTILIAFMACLMLMPIEVVAQRLHLQLFFSSLNNKRKEVIQEAQNVPVWLFLKQSDANRASDELRQNGTLSNKAKYYQAGITDNNGVVELMTLGGTANGYFLIDTQSFGLSSFAIVKNVADLKPKAEEGGATFYMTYTFKDDATMLQTTEVKDKRKEMEITEMDASKFGRDVSFTATILIDSVYARDDARFVVSPFLVLPSENNATIGFFEPHVVDGPKYIQTNLRRTGFDLKHDKLSSYMVDTIEVYGNDKRPPVKDHFMHQRKNGRFTFKQWIYDFDFTRHYIALGHSWYEDYNHVYYQNVDRLWDGNFKEPNRFLDWSSVHSNLDINPENYFKRGVAGENHVPENYHLEFIVGKPTLNTEDSLTVSELARLKKIMIE